AKELSNFIRAMYPWPSAFTFFKDERIKIIKAQPLEGRGISGRVEKASNGKLIVGTNDGLLLIEELQPEGRKPMKASAFLASRRLIEGNDTFD
ncbi:MAG: methionyl-tRNA formyltransferase, partial [Thermodesulfovibrionales bacterium]|nr:methionyl-tRNA formyltransferase [Thermodesulfovibrionales bacterium]